MSTPNSQGVGTLLIIINTLAPIILVITLGWILMRTGFFSSQALIDLNRLTYWVGLPSLLVYRIAEASPDVSAVTGLLVVGTGATVAGIVAALLVARLVRMPGDSHGTFAQGVFRGNLTFIGLPIVLYAFAGTDSAQVEANALLAFGPMVVVYNVLAVLVLLLGSGAGESREVLRPAVHGLVTNPILIACALGLLLALTGVQLPELGQRTLAAIGQMALPLALLCIGGTLYTSRIRGNISWAVTGAVMKVALVPAVGFLLALWVGLSAEQTRIALILLACPTASASYILVKQMNGNEALASGIIVVSNLLAAPALFIVLAVTG